MLKIQRIDHLVLPTTNVEACVKFYCRLLGMAPDFANHRMALKFGEQKINIHGPESHLHPVAANPMPGNRLFSLETGASREAFTRYLKAMGGRPAPSPFVGAGGMDSPLYLADPDGNIIEIICRGEYADTQIRLLSEIALKVADMTASTLFYMEFAGMKAESAADHMTVLSCGNARIRLVEEPLMPDMVKGSCDFCLLAAGASGKRAAKMGYERLVELDAPLEPDLGVVERHGAISALESVYLRDPDRNLVEIGVPAAPIV